MQDMSVLFGPLAFLALILGAHVALSLRRRSQWRREIDRMSLIHARLSGRIAGIDWARHDDWQPVLEETVALVYSRLQPAGDAAQMAKPGAPASLDLARRDQAQLDAMMDDMGRRLDQGDGASDGRSVIVSAGLLVCMAANLRRMAVNAVERREADDWIRRLGGLLVTPVSA